MLNVFKRSHREQPTAEMARALADEGLPPGMDPTTLRVLEQQGSYAGRRVKYFRVFDPVRAAERAVQVRVFADLDAHAELVLGSGHVEQDGAVVLSRRERTPLSTTHLRREADRAAHGDDERFVFPDRGAS
jgi:hypothetical protein